MVLQNDGRSAYDECSAYANIPSAVGFVDIFLVLLIEKLFLFLYTDNFHISNIAYVVTVCVCNHQ